VDNKVIKPSVKLRQSNIKPFKWLVILPLKQKMYRFKMLQKKDFMAAINSLNKLICYKEWRKYQVCLWRLVLIISLNWNRNDNFIKISEEKIIFYVIMITVFFMKYFCNITLCFLWRFDDKMSVIYREIVCV
jgi:hypothetical protein